MGALFFVLAALLALLAAFGVNIGSLDDHGLGYLALASVALGLLLGGSLGDLRNRV